MQQQSPDSPDSTKVRTSPAVDPALAAAYSAVLDDPNLLHLIVQHLVLFSRHTSCVSAVWRQASHYFVAPGIHQLVHSLTLALEASSVEERGLACVACSDTPEAPHHLGCLGCGAPLWIRGLSDRQQDRWAELYRDEDGEDFDTWLLFDNYSHGQL